MLAHRVIGCTVILAAVVSAAPPVRACERPFCIFPATTFFPTTPEPEPEVEAAAPLQLNTFTKRKAKAARSTAQRASKNAVPAASGKRIKVAKRAVWKHRVRHARRTPARPALLVRSIELDEIKRTTRTAAAGQASMAFAAEPTDRRSEAINSQNIEPPAEATPPAPLSPAPQVRAPQVSGLPAEVASERPDLEATERLRLDARERHRLDANERLRLDASVRQERVTDAPALPDHWAIRLWTMLERGFSAVAIGARRLAE